MIYFWRIVRTNNARYIVSCSCSTCATNCNPKQSLQVSVSSTKKHSTSLTPTLDTKMLVQRNIPTQPKLGMYDTDIIYRYRGNFPNSPPIHIGIGSWSIPYIWTNGTVRSVVPANRFFFHISLELVEYWMSYLERGTPTTIQWNICGSFVRSNHKHTDPMVGIKWTITPLQYCCSMCVCVCVCVCVSFFTKQSTVCNVGCQHKCSSLSLVYVPCTYNDSMTNVRFANCPAPCDPTGSIDPSIDWLIEYSFESDRDARTHGIWVNAGWTLVRSTTTCHASLPNVSIQ
jgi:hypothetical protein